jgi:hypothetical protein
MKPQKPKKKDVVSETTVVYNKVEIDPVNIIAEFESKDKTLKAIVKHNRLTSTHEIDFYKDKKKIATESYAYHTRRYHEDAAENYVNGIKKIDENKMS